MSSDQNSTAVGATSIVATMVNKVVTTMVIRPLDDPTSCAQSVVADLQQLGLEYVGAGYGHIRCSHIGSY